MNGFRSTWFRLALVLFMTPLAGHSQDLGKGETYDRLDVQARKTITYFEDAIAIAERGKGAKVQTVLSSADGRELFRLTYLPGAGKLALTRPSAKRVEVVGDMPSAAMHADWLNLQAYSLWHELSSERGERPGLRWRDGFIRAATAVAEPREDFETYRDRRAARIVAIETYTDRLLAISVRQQLPPEGARRADVAYWTFKTQLFDRQTRAPLGVLRWYGTEELLTWDFPGRTRGFVSRETLPDGWTFRPDLAWANLQSFSFWQSHGGSWLKDDPGCDGLHWLDYSIFRPCCDDHDRCYSRNGCTSRSWWLVWSGWTCTQCNLVVVSCFASGGGTSSGGGSTPLPPACSGNLLSCPQECSRCEP